MITKSVLSGSAFELRIDNASRQGVGDDFRCAYAERKCWSAYRFNATSVNTLAQWLGRSVHLGGASVLESSLCSFEIFVGNEHTALMCHLLCDSLESYHAQMAPGAECVGR